MKPEMKVGHYALIVLGLLAVSLIPLLPLTAPSSRNGLLVGAGLATANTLAAFALARWAAPRSTQAFLWAVIGGMTVRLMLVGASVALAIVAIEIPVPALALSLLGYFSVFLILELVILGRKMPPVPEGATR